jgi:hypothetical protein
MCVPKVGGEERIKILVSKTEGKRPVGRYRRRLKYNIEMNLREIACANVDPTHLILDMNSDELLWTRYKPLSFKKDGNFLTSCVTISFTVLVVF